MAGAVLLTGATSGLGLALARLYAAKGATLVLVGRKPLAELDAPFFTPRTYCQADLSQPGSVGTILEFLKRADIRGLDVLIHNAGLGLYGEVAAHSDEAVKGLLEVNLYTPVALTRALLGRTRKVVFVSSVVADVPAPDYAVYGASKAALDAFARNLRLETRGSPPIQSIHPGAIRTDMHVKSGVPAGKLDTARFPGADEVAEEIFRAISGSRTEVTVGFNNKLVRLTGRYLAAPLDALMRQLRRRAEG